MLWDTGEGKGRGEQTAVTVRESQLQWWHSVIATAVGHGVE
jgi:hypothetical protein